MTIWLPQLRTTVTREVRLLKQSDLIGFANRSESLGNTRTKLEVNCKT